MRHQHLYSRQAPCNSLQGGNTSSTPKPPPACVPAAVVVQQGNICLNPPRPANTHTNTSANCRAHYQWLALQPQAPHTLHQQQVRQAAQHWLQSHWLRQEHKQEQKHGLKHGQKPNLVWSYCGPYALLAAAFCNIGVDATAPDMLDAEGWAAVLQLYGADLLTQRNIAANTQANPTAAHPLHNCARRWTQIEAADKCLRTGLQEWSPAVALARAGCQLADIPAPDGICASLAWCEQAQHRA